MNMRASVEHLVREVFQDVRKSFRIAENASEARREWIQEHASVVEEIERVEKRIRNEEEEQVTRRREIEKNSEASRKQSFVSNLEAPLANKYALIQSKDLFPEVIVTEDKTRAKERWEEKPTATASENFASKPKTVKRIKNHLHKFAKARSDETILSTRNRALKPEKPQKSIIRTEVQRTILVARPATIEFVNFEPRKLYKKVVAIKNVSNAVAKFQVEATRSPRSKFSLILRSRTGDRENLAPGIDAKIIVAFRSEDAEDCEECFVVKVQFGKEIFLVARAYRDPPILKAVSHKSKSDYIEPRSFDAETSNVSLNETCGSCESSSGDFLEDFDIVSSKTETSETDQVVAVKEPPTVICGSLSFAHFDCNKCFVGERTVVATRLRNIGGDGRFFAMSEIDWNSMSINDITTKNLIVLTCFAVWPAYFHLKRGEEIELLTYFFPNSQGVQVDKLYIVCDNFAVHPIELIGDGLAYDRDFFLIGENAEENSWFENYGEEETCEYTIDLGVALPNSYLKNTVTITNSSGMEIHYRWDKRSTVDRERQNRFQAWRDFPLNCLSVKPSCGIFRPCSAIVFKISARTTNLPGELYRAVLQLILEDIPNAAIDKEYEDRAEISRSNNRRFCESSMDLRAKEIEVWIRCKENLDSETLNSSNSCEDIVEDKKTQLPVLQTRRRSASA